MVTASFGVDANLGPWPAGPERSGAMPPTSARRSTSSHDGLFGWTFDVKIHFEEARF